MPDTNANTSPLSPDVRLMRVARKLEGAANYFLQNGVVSIRLTSEEWTELRRDLVEISASFCDSTPATDLIQILQSCRTKGCVMAAVADHATLLRTLAPGDAARVQTELWIALARQWGDGR